MDFDKPKRRELPSKPPVVPVGQAPHEPAVQPEKVAIEKTQRPKVTKKKPTKRTLIIIGIIVAVIITTLSIMAFSGQSSENQPQYKTALPPGKTITSLGGWRRVSPPDSEPVYAFVDTLADVSITVSQQPLPKTGNRTPEQQLEEMAKGFNATERVKDTDAFIGTSAKGPQSVFFLRGSTLIMIKSQAEIPVSDWSAYIRALR